MPNTPSHRALALATLGALLLYFSLAFFYQAPLLNNGDYQRITQGLISMPVYEALSNACFAIDSSALYLPFSIPSLIFETTLLINLAVGRACWSIEGYFVLLCSIYLLGVIFVIWKKQLNLSIAISLVIAPLFFSPFLKSLYEEGVVLALIPWLIFFINVHKKQGSVIGLLVVIGLMLLSKLQLLLMIPTILYFVVNAQSPSTPHSSKLKLWVKTSIFGIALMALVGAGVLSKQSQNDGYANAYNRLFNGIGWALQEVQRWPVNTFTQRLDYFYSHQKTLQAPLQNTEPYSGQALWGTSYWPTGLELLTSGNDPQWQQIEALLTPMTFAKYFYHHPQLIAQYLTSAAAVFVSSDYSLHYLKVKSNTSQSNAPQIQSALLLLNDALLASCAILYCLLMISVLLNRAGFGRLVAIATILFAPLAIVLGDGYFEYEKHMMPFFMCMPILLLLIRPKKKEVKSQA